METPPGIERDVGLERYLTDTPGTGGRLKAFPEDFVVDEVPLAFPPPVADGKYTVAALRARNWETNRLVGELARRLGVARETIFFAGTKDKRAVTTQYVSLRASEERVRALELKDVEILETRRVDRAPKIGELVGNRFALKVRDLDVPLDEAEARAKAALDRVAEERGFPNYFGVQRFGARRPITHRVGEAIVRGRMDEAVRLYAGNPEPGDDPESRAAREAFERDGPEAALELYPRYCDFERKIARHLVEQPGDADGAILRLPGNLRTMFVYAYQSLLFNRMVSERLRRGIGLNEPLEGDLVVGVDANGRPERDRLHEVTPRNLARVQKLCAQGKALVTGAIFGSEAPLATGVMGEIERQAVSAENLTREDFLVPHLPELGSHGTRRELLAPLGPVALRADEDAHGTHLELSFFLLKGSYATCLMREVLKSEAAAFA